MGSYGIGVSRVPAALIESSIKKEGIVWPKNVSPFDVILLNLSNQNSFVSKFCEDLYLKYKSAGIDILLDDRDERAGVKFSDADLLGIPFVILVGKNYVNNKSVTIINKYLDEEIEIPNNEAEQKIKDLIRKNMISFFELWVSYKFLFPKTKEKFFSIITFISFAGIALGVATLIIVMSVMNGFRDELTSKILGVNGHLKIRPFNNLKIEKHDDFKKEIEQNFTNLNVHKIIVGQGLLNHRSYSSGIFMKGVEIDYFIDRKIFHKKIKNETLNSFKKNEGVIIGEKIRDKLNLKIGDKINIISPDNMETILGAIPRSVNFEIVGFFSVGMYEYDSSMIFIPTSLMQKFLNIDKKIDFFEIYIENFSQIESSKKN